MQDVIFNGTNNRKPASRASVELVFDNADHRAGGQWGQFGEIAVKRVLTRDGTSSYYINNQPVRRRDVQDVFLGTGLGPRAYAIIGQGTISRIIESKPEELRLFLEEAAGVSKYKERRRETENRLSDTRENLTRVEDILRELNANLDKLEKQAEVAQQLQRLAGRRDAQAAPAVVPQAQRERGRPGARCRPRPRRPSMSWKAAWPTCATSRPSWKPSARPITRPATRSTRRRACCTKPVPRWAGWRPKSALWSKAASAWSSAWSQLQEQAAQWATRKEDAEAEIETLAEPGARGRRDRPRLLAAQVEEQAQPLPDLEEALRQAQARANEQRASVTQVQQQIQVLAADQRNIEEQSRQLNSRRERLARRPQRAGRA